MNKQTALLQMHFAATLFGVSGIFGYLIIADSVTISMGRSFFAVIALTWLCFKFRFIPWRISLKAFYALLITGILLTGHWVTFFYAIKIGNIAVATLGFACFPAFVTLFEMLFFKEKISSSEYSLLIFVSIGLILVTPSFNFNNNATLGLFWGIISGIFYASTVVINRYNLSKTTGVQACWWQCLVVFVTLLPVTITSLPNVPPLDWLWIACLGLFCTGLSYYLVINSLSTIKARTASIIIALEPVYAILTAWLLFNQQPTIRTIIGGFIIILAVIWAGIQKASPNEI